MGLIFNGNGDVIRAVDGSLTVEGIDLGGSANINAGIVTGTSANFTGAVSVGGVLTYEDVKNVDSVGIITARDHINIVTDNKKIQIGAGQDLTLHHDGTHSYITNTTGDLRIVDTTGMLLRSNSLDLRNGAGDENYITCAANGAVSLYYDNVKTFYTNTNGAIVQATEGGDANLFFYADEGDDNADKWLMQSESDGFFALKNYASGSWETSIKATGNAAVELYHDNSLRLQTTSDGTLTRSGGAYVNHSLSAGSNVAGKVLGWRSGNDCEVGFAHPDSNTWFVRYAKNLSSGALSEYHWGSILPGSNNTYDLGLTGTRWRNVYISGVIDASSDISIADTIKHTGDTDTKIRFPANDVISFERGGGEALRITTANALLTNGVTTEPLYPHYTTARKIQAEIKGALDVGQTRHHGSLAVNCTNSNSFIGLTRSDNTQTDGTGIGVLGWSGFDGTDFHQAAAIEVVKGAGAGNDDQPGHMIFKTNSGTTSATERLRITSAGDVGIGYNSPTVKLHVREGASGASSYDNRYHMICENSGEAYLGFYVPDNSYAGIRFHDTTGAEGYIDYYMNDDAMHFYSTGNHIFKAGGTERLRIDSSGRNIINSTSNGSRAISGDHANLQVEKNSSGLLSLLRTSNDNGAAWLAIAKSRSAAGAACQAGDNIGAIAFTPHDGTDLNHHAAEIRGYVDTGIGSNDTPGYLTFHTNGGTTTTTERLRIDSSGHMGLGITPSDIDSIGRALNIASSTGGAIYLQDTDSPTGKFAAISYNGGTAALQIHAHHSASYIDLGTNGTERLRIDSSGHVMIGTSTEGFASYGDQFTIANSGHCGMTIRSGTSSDGNIYFSDGTSGSDEVRGFVEYNHSSNFMQLGTNGAARLRINSEGHRILAYQPRFLAYRGSSSITSVSSGTITGWNNVKYDVGSNFSSGTKFTAPTTGTYMFGVNIRWGCSGKVRVVRVQLDHYNSSNGGKGNYGGGIGGANDYDGSSGYDHPYTSFTNLVEMDAGDYVQVALQEVAYSGQLDIQAQGFTTNFWGCLMF